KRMVNLLIPIAAALGCAFAAVLYGEDVQVPAGNVNVPTSNETLVLTSHVLTTPNPNGKAVIRASIELTVGLGTTAITIAVYAGSAIGGRLIGTKIPDAGDFSAGNNATFSVELVDPFDNTTGVQYCVSVM